MKKLHITECPRDAMQGWKKFIPTHHKIEYLNQLLKVGFDVLDFGSFVSPKAIPQLADTKEVIPKLNLKNNSTKLLAIIANTRGAEDAVVYDEIHYLGFPFSISETFQMKNTNKSIAQSLNQVEEIQKLCIKNKKELVIYISMGFGNPYGDDYHASIATDWFKKLSGLGIKTIALADTIGIAQPAIIKEIFGNIIPEFPEMKIGAHFHSTADKWEEKIESAYKQDCFHFDSSISGIGGCPMADNELVGNIATENLIHWAQKKEIPHGLDLAEFKVAQQMANTIFT